VAVVTYVVTATAVTLTVVVATVTVASAAAVTAVAFVLSCGGSHCCFDCCGAPMIAVTVMATAEAVVFICSGSCS